MPCKAKGIPRLVKMHNKHAKDGLVVLSVLLDDPRDKDQRKDTEQYLGKQKPPFETVFLDEKQEFWTKKLRIFVYPRVFVFNREGLHVKNLPVLDEKDDEKEPVDYDVVEKTTEQLLTKK